MFYAKLFTILLLFMFCLGSLSAQTDYSFQSPYRSFEEGQLYVTLQDQAIIYLAPSTKATPLTQLPITSILQIEERMDELHTENGFETNWYRVSFTQDRQEQEGFIWGGNIAMQQEIREDVQFIYGLAKIVPADRGDYIENVVHLKVAMCKNGQLLDQIIFPVLGSLYTKTKLSASDNKGVQNIHSILNIALSDSYCGGVSANITIFAQNNNLHYIDMLHNGFGDHRFESRYYIYPDDQEGKKDRIILRDEAGIVTSQQKIQYDYQKEDYYQWSGSQLIQIN